LGRDGKASDREKFRRVIFLQKFGFSFCNSESSNLRYYDNDYHYNNPFMVSQLTKFPLQVANPEKLERIRHTCAHVMAMAVQVLFPETKVTI
jgi:threonyl-tRNA synthetase